MSEYLINGGSELNGSIKISGAKNAALKLMAASLLTSEEVTLENVPLIEDVYTMAEALRSLGATVQIGKNKLTISAKELTNCTAPYDLVSKMRASILVMGPLLARLGQSKTAMPGGCKIGLRKIDIHIKGLEALGAEISLEHGYIDAKAKKLRGAQFHLDFPSVGATENILMASVLAKGTTTIKNVAREPELVDLANFLNNLGANIKGAGTSELVVRGVKRLGGGRYRVMADRIEAGTFMVAGALCAKKLELTDFDPQNLPMTLEKLKETGTKLEVKTDSVIIRRNHSANPCNIVTLPHPGFATDLQGPFMVLLSLAKGQSIITENVFEGRFLLADELKKMGADIKTSGHHAVMDGVEALSAADVEAPDLRGGASLVLAGLTAKGETHVSSIEHIDRGYEELEQKLVSVGAQIVRKTSDKLLSPQENTQIVTTKQKGLQQVVE